MEKKLVATFLRPGRDLIFVTFLLAVMSVLFYPHCLLSFSDGASSYITSRIAVTVFTILGYALVSLVMASICLEWLRTRFSPYVAMATACSAILLLVVGHLSFLAFRSIEIARSDIQQRTFET